MGGRSTLYCQGEELVLMVLPDVCLYCQWQLILPALSLKFILSVASMINTANRRSFLLLVTTAWFKGKILGVAWYKGNLLKGKFCFIQGDDYISTSGEALAL
ncbi:hypothetical protein Tco_0840576 [Tanacetum coccineum]|uniref:Uncharacterized protein n=1 Tax=Tanacetum coccineum TaxID=301880 RepID=A0ABQ5AYW3_9ASTR